MKRKYDRHWAIRIGVPGEHILYFSSTLFWKRRDAVDHMKMNLPWAKLNNWKIVEIMEKKK